MQWIKKTWFFPPEDLPTPNSTTIAPFYQNEQKRAKIEEIIRCLQKLSWLCVDVNLTHAQIAVINDRRSEISSHLLENWQ